MLRAETTSLSHWFAAAVSSERFQIWSFEVILQSFMATMTLEMHLFICVGPRTSHCGNTYTSKSLKALLIMSGSSSSDLPSRLQCSRKLSTIVWISLILDMTVFQVDLQTLTSYDHIINGQSFTICVHIHLQFSRFPQVLLR